MKGGIPGKRIIILISYALVFALMTIPLIGHLNTAVLGQGPDPYQYIWNAFVFSHAVTHVQNPFYTDLVFYPEGSSLILHTYTPVIGLVNSFIHSPYLSVNLVVMMNLAIAGLGTFLIGKHYKLSDLSAWLCGFCFAFSPYISSHMLEHVHLLLVGFVPFYVLAHFKLFPEQRWSSFSFNKSWMIIAFISGLITLFSDYYTSFFLIFFSMAFAIWLSAKTIQWKNYKPWLIIVVVWLVSHLAIEFAVQHSWDDKGAFYNTSDLVALITPPENSMIYQDHFAEWRSQMGFKGPNEQVMFLGFILVVATALLSFRINKNSWPLGFFALIFLLLSLPKIKWLGYPLTYSPFAFIHYVPFLNNLRNPSRFAEMLYLFVPLFVMVQWQDFQTRNSIRATWLTLLVSAIVVFEFWPVNYPLIHSSEVSEYSYKLQERSDVKVIWNIPTGYADGFTKEGEFDVQLLQDQLVHRKKLLGGYISRLPRERFETFSDDSVIMYMNQLAEGFQPEQIGSINLKNFIRDRGIGAIVVSLKLVNVKEELSFLLDEQDIPYDVALTNEHFIYYLQLVR